MTLLGQIFIYIIFALAFAGTALCVHSLMKKEQTSTVLVEQMQSFITICFVAASAILLLAFYASDFSFKYVASYSSRDLPVFYRLTAFWGGQAGSLLFWALLYTLFVSFFQKSEGYKSLSNETKTWYMLLTLITMMFFAYVLSTHNAPFEELFNIPADGRGLNPLLQHPGMIFHPPLLFIGYAGFTAPAFLALAQALSGKENDVAGQKRWFQLTKNMVLFSWLNLTAGIILGAWWAYMELGWGGYWAWDPVENASVIPWFFSTAAIHLGFLEAYRQKTARLHVLFIALSHISAFVATWLVRGNVVESIHAFGAGGIGPSLLVYILANTALAFFVTITIAPNNDKSLNGLETREGFFIATALMLLTLSLLIFIATLWPVISSLWSEQSVGLDANFYNKTCLPLFTVLLALLAICPWLKWNGGIISWSRFGAVVGAFVLSIIGLWTWADVKLAMPLMSASLAIATVISILLHLIHTRYHRISPALVHIGFALIVLGVSFSGPYKEEKQVTLARGASVELADFTVELVQLYEGRAQAAGYEFLEAELVLKKEGVIVGVVNPQQRIYNKFPEQAYAEAATLPSLGDEFYATLLGINSQTEAVLRISSHPLVNWLWIGSVFMILAPFITILAASQRRREDNTEE